VFDRFKQAGHRKGGSTGLGREMVHAHGGTVIGESPGEGQGSCFTIRLPLSLSPADQACRLWNLRELQCRDALDALIAEGFLLQTPSGAFIAVPFATRVVKAR
jgi:hypothetical protein